MQDQRVKTNAAVIDIKPPPLESMVADRVEGKNGSMKRIKSPINATSYTVAALQIATNSFSQEFLIGEGSLGRVYKGDFPNGKVISISIPSIFKYSSAAKDIFSKDIFFWSIFLSVIMLRSL